MTAARALRYGMERPSETLALGLVAGLGLGGGIFYYRSLVEMHLARGLVPKIVMVHADVSRVLRLATARKRQELAEYLAGLLGLLAGAGAQVAAIPAFAPQVCADELLAIAPLPLISLLDEVVAEIGRRQLRRVAVFGAAVTMETAMFGRLTGVEVVPPMAAERERIAAIYARLVATGVGTADDLDDLRRLAHGLISRERLDAIGARRDGSGVSVPSGRTRTSRTSTGPACTSRRSCAGSPRGCRVEPGVRCADTGLAAGVRPRHRRGGLGDTTLCRGGGAMRTWPVRVLLVLGLALVGVAFTQAPAGARPERVGPVARDPHTPGYPPAKDLPDGVNAPANADGNFILGPTHPPAPEMLVREGVPQGARIEFTMLSTESAIYPGIARTPGTFGTVDPSDPAKLLVPTSHPAPYTRRVVVYVPKQYVAGTPAPFLVGADGPDEALFRALDNLIAEHKVPAMVAISIGNGSGDAQGSERGLEYDTMSGRYAEFVEREVLPRAEATAHVTLTKDPEGRATMGGSSGGSCALIMAWYHPEWYRRVLTYSGTYVNQQWPPDAKTPHGAWEFHEHLLPGSAPKPLRLWMEVGDRDLLNPNVMRDGMHDWMEANERMAEVLAAKGYHYQFVFARNAGHVDRAVKEQTLPEALQYLWEGYSGSGR